MTNDEATFIASIASMVLFDFPSKPCWATSQCRGLKTCNEAARCDERGDFQLAAELRGEWLALEQQVLGLEEIN